MSHPALAGVRHAVVRGVDPRRGDRVELELPWLPAGERERTRAAAVLLPLASSGAGAWVLPAPGDAVLVMFESGDVDRPVVVGATWSHASPPPADARLPDGGDRRLLRSARGHQLAFEDGAEPAVVVSSAGGRERLGVGRPRRRVPGAPALSDVRDGGVVLAAEGGALEVACGGRVSLRAPVVELTATGPARLTVEGALAVEATDAAALAGDTRAALAGIPIALGATA